MGLQEKNSDIAAVNGASIIVINQACNSDQLLVSLSKNGQEWLSPIGWTEQQKVTLLDCRPRGETTEVDIPAEFASAIKSGDVLVLRCSELDLEKEIIWEASDIETRSTEDVSSSTTGLAAGLLSRFKAPKTETIKDTKSEAELRAEEAGRAAQNYKAKMEAAAEAKEKAQRKALEAAREAEAALKMEAERIAEMERAAKAFEEAERLKQDELRRVEEERRAEEARQAEEARLIEEARKREIAAKKDLERKAALERYTSALTVTRDEEMRLKSRLKELKHQVKSDAANIAVQKDDLQTRQALLIDNEGKVAKRFESYEKNASKLDEMNADLSLLQSESKTLNTDRQALSIRLSQADADYQQAQQEAEAAMARAVARLTELDLIREEDSKISERVKSVSEKLSSQSQAITQTSEKTQKLQSQLENAQSELVQARVEIEALEVTLLSQEKQEQNLRLEIEATQQAIEDSQLREAAQRDAIEHLEAGGEPEDIAEVDFEVRNLEFSSLHTPEQGMEDMPTKPDSAGLPGITALKDPISQRLRSNFTRQKDVQISVDVEDIVLETPEVNPVLLAGIDDSPSFMRRHGSSLMALGAVIGGIAILSGGWALNTSSTPKFEVKSTTPAPTQVASVVSKVELPKMAETAELKAASEAVDMKLTALDTETDLVSIDLPKIEINNSGSKTVETTDVQDVKIEAETRPEPELTVSEAKTDVLIKDAKTATELEVEALIVKLAEVVDPMGFAFELPNMQPMADSKTVEMKAKSKKVKAAKKPTPETSELKNTRTIKTAEVTKTKAKSAPKINAEVNYPELTSDIQTRLFKLGFYNGEINGLQGQATKDAITNFKTLFSMSDTSDKITGALLTELKRAEREQEATALQAQTQLEAEQSTIQFADVAPTATFYDTIQAAPSTPVLTDTLPAADEFTSDTNLAPAYVAPEPQPEPESIKIASIPAVISEPAPTPAVQDVVVEAQMLKNASAKYPSAAQRRNYFVNVAIQVAFDIGVDGRPANLRIISNDHTGKYNEAFEKEAMGAIKKMRYEPKTVNGVAVETKAKSKRIVFRTE